MSLTQPNLSESKTSATDEPRVLVCSGTELMSLAQSILEKGCRFRMRAPGLSMGHTIQDGELIEVAPCQPDDLRAGTIVFYQREDRPVAHRIIRRLETNGDVTFLLRGDTLLGTAEVVPADAILGRVTAVWRGDRWQPLTTRVLWCLYGRLAPWLIRFIEGLGASPTVLGPDQGRANPRGNFKRLTYELMARGPAGNPLETVELSTEPFFIWEKWIDLVEREGLGALIGYWCRTDDQFAKVLPEAVHSKLTQLYYATSARNLRIFSGAASVIERLHQTGIEVIALKGAHLAEAVYPSVGCRPMGDVDLLLRPGDFPEVARILSNLGYEAITGPEAKAPLSVDVTLNSSMWRHPDQHQLLLHLHWHLRNTSLPYGLVTAVDDERLWANGQLFELAGSPVRGLAPHHLLLHLADHAVVHRYDRLVLLADMAAVIERYGESLDWPLLLDEAQAFGLSSSLAMSLKLAVQYASAPVPSSILDTLEKVRLTFPERRLVDQFERQRGSILWGWFIYWSRCPTWKKRFRYLWLTLWPDRPRLALQASGSIKWRGYLAFCVHRLVGNIRNRYRRTL